MRNLSLVLFFLLSFQILFAQKEEDFQAWLPISGNYSELGISPSGEIWIATKTGHVYHTKELGQLWEIGPNAHECQEDQPFWGPLYERINFFSNDTLMISGYMHEPESESRNFVYWSGDHGKSWEKIRFGRTSWIDAAFINKKGKAWMSGSSQKIYYSEDSGRSWKEFDKAGPERALRFNTIHFAKDEKTGLFGSFYNVIYRTTNNCESFEKLPTPLHQEKYTPLSEHHRPDIRKIRIFGNNYMVNQQGNIFISPSHPIDWKPLPEIIDFEVTDDEKVYTVDKYGSVSLYSTNFTEIWQSEEKLKVLPSILAVHKEQLLVHDGRSIIQTGPGKQITSVLKTTDVNIPEPYLKTLHKGELYGHLENEIYKFDKQSDRWFTFRTLDFPIRDMLTWKGELLVGDANLHKSPYYKIDLNTKTLSKQTIPTTLFAGLEVKSILFQTGSVGCFHNDLTELEYRLKKGEFVRVRNRSIKNKSSVPKSIPQSGIKSLLQLLDESRFEKLNIEDFSFTKKDIEAFEQKLLEVKEEMQKNKPSPFGEFAAYTQFVPGEYADFEFYKRVGQKIDQTDNELIDQAMWNSYGNKSTTTDWHKISFRFKDGRELTVISNDDITNYLMMPWKANFEGYQFSSNSVLFGEKLNELTKGNFLRATSQEKSYAIFRIASLAYLNHLKSE